MSEDELNPAPLDAEMLEDIARLLRGYAKAPNGDSHHKARIERARQAVLGALRSTPAPEGQGVSEPCRPDILERLKYHQGERDDLTLDDCWEVLASGYKKVRQRQDRAMVMQIMELLASQSAALAAQPVQEVVAPADAGRYADLIARTADTLREALKVREYRADGDLSKIADRVLHMACEDRDLINGQRVLIDRMKSKPAPAAQVPLSDFPERIMNLLLEVADRKGPPGFGPFQDGDGEPMQDDADAALAWLAAHGIVPPEEKAK